MLVLCSGSRAVLSDFCIYIFRKGGRKRGRRKEVVGVRGRPLEAGAGYLA